MLSRWRPQSRPKKAILLVLGILLLVAASATTVYFAYRTVSTTGDRAVSAMNAEELAALARLTTITRTMSVEEVYEVLGQPSEDLYFMAKWNGFGGSQLSQTRVYFINQHPVKVRWMKVGYFVYERRV